MSTEPRIHVLIVALAPTLAEGITRALESSGLSFASMRVETKADFVAALETFAPQAIVLDRQLPICSGDEALAYVRREHPELPVVIVSDPLGDEAAVALLRAGAKDYVLKTNLARLATAVEEAVLNEQGIRARKATERRFRESEEKFRAMAEAAQDAIVMIDGDGVILFWNRAAERIFGYSAAEAAGQKIHDWLAAPRFRDDANAGLAAFAKSGRGAVIGRTVELVALRKDCAEIAIEASISAVSAGGAWRAVAIIRDVAERQQALSIAQLSERA